MPLRFTLLRSKEDCAKGEVHSRDHLNFWFGGTKSAESFQWIRRFAHSHNSHCYRNIRTPYILQQQHAHKGTHARTQTAKVHKFMVTQTHTSHSYQLASLSRSVSRSVLLFMLFSSHFSLSFCQNSIDEYFSSILVFFCRQQEVTVTSPPYNSEESNENEARKKMPCNHIFLRHRCRRRRHRLSLHTFDASRAFNERMNLPNMFNFFSLSFFPLLLLLFICLFIVSVWSVSVEIR